MPGTNRGNPTIAKLRQIPDQKIFEIGRYALNGDKEPRTRAQLQIDLFILRYYLDRNPDAVIFGHVTDKFKLDIFKQKYGLELVEEIPIPETGTTEYLTSVKASDMAAVIRKRLNLAPLSDLEKSEDQSRFSKSPAVH